MLAHHQHADALGPTELVARHRDQIGRRGGGAQVQPCRGLHRVGVQRHTGDLGLVRAHDLRDGVEVLHDAGLVVGQHHRHDRRVRTDLGQRVRQGGQVDATRAVDRHDPSVERCDGVEHRMVLDRRADRHSGARRHAAADRVVVGLGPPGGEHDLARCAAECGGHPLTGLVDRPHRVAGQAVRARRVPVAIVQERGHRLAHLGTDARRRCVVQVGQGAQLRGGGGRHPRHATALRREGARGTARPCRRGPRRGGRAPAHR